MSELARFALVVIGGGPAGLAAARSYREAGGGGAVAIVADEQRMPYRRPPLTKEVLRGELDERELPIEPESWLAQNAVALICDEAITITPDARTVRLAGGRELRYEHCVLSTGARPVRPPIPGSDDPAVRVIRTIEDVRELRSRLRDDEPVVVVGGGFIGCEAAASLARRGCRVSMVCDQPAPNAARLGTDVAARIARWLRFDGVTLHLGSPARQLVRVGRQIAVSSDEVTIDAATVVMAAGARPRSRLAQAAGIGVADGAIVVDSQLRTDTPHVLAAGDVCRALNVSAGRPLRVEHWGEALAQGEIAGHTAAGVTAHWGGVPGFWSTIGDRTLKYAAWGDGYDQVVLDTGDDEAFTAWYLRDDRIVGLLTHEADDDYERGRDLVKRGKRWGSDL